MTTWPSVPTLSWTLEEVAAWAQERHDRIALEGVDDLNPNGAISATVRAHAAATHVWEHTVLPVPADLRDRLIAEAARDAVLRTPSDAARDYGIDPDAYVNARRAVDPDSRAGWDAGLPSPYPGYRRAMSSDLGPMPLMRHDGDLIGDARVVPTELYGRDAVLLQLRFALAAEILVTLDPETARKLGTALIRGADLQSGQDD